MNSKHSLFAFALLLLAAVVGGGVPVLIKISLLSIPPFTFTFLRFFLASLSFLPLLLALRIKISLNKSLFVISLLATANIILFVFGIPYSSAFIAQLLYSLSPICISIISVIWFKKKINRNSLIGIILGVFGIAAITIPPIIQSFEKNEIMYGSFLIFAGVISFSLYSIKSKEMQIRNHPVLLTFIFCFITMLFCLPFMLYEMTSNQNIITHLTLNNMIPVFFVGILGSVVFYLLLQYAVKFGSPLISSLTLFIQPVMTYFWGYFLLNETITPTVLLSALLIFASAYLVVKEKN